MAEKKKAGMMKDMMPKGKKKGAAKKAVKGKKPKPGGFNGAMFGGGTY